MRVCVSRCGEAPSGRSNDNPDAKTAQVPSSPVKGSTHRALRASLLLSLSMADASILSSLKRACTNPNKRRPNETPPHIVGVRTTCHDGQTGLRCQ